MTTPAGLRPASPPAISGAAAVASCAAMAVSYVVVLYAPTVVLRFPPPISLRAFLHRRFACAAVASAASALATAALLRVWSLGDFADMFAVFGIRNDHLLEALVIPLLLTSLVYAGSFVNRLWLIGSSWGGDGDEVGIGCAQRLVLRIQAALDDVMVWRNYVVVCSSSSSYNCSVVLLIIIRRCCKPVIKDYSTIYRGAGFQGMHDTTSSLWWIHNVYDYFSEPSLLQSSTLKPFVRTTTAGMQFYEIATDCRCPVRLHYNLWVVCSIFVHSYRSGISSISGWFCMFLLAPFPCYES
ncbi:CAAX prenyl protease 2 [Dichanthelium oligosanthes]|uniref:CAAX prenyl protease 2 n=1 Tax=Dichanthelium oligosanthes TaxID=888268 RepID=A0A1E5VPB1_9POAL|nr:CAAX prenyl protease 2 [Dichanthelium oligosanthes]